jgi:acyl-CoA synthetase (AMP-forming)/AMP-acid ligase II
MSTVHEIARGGKLIDGPSGVTVPLDQRADRVAALLTARGFGPGDVLAIWAPNIAPWAGVALGALRCGGCVTGLHPLTPPAEAARLLAGASIVVTTPELTASARAIAAGAMDVIEIGPGLLACEPVPLAPVDPDSAALRMWSSGTTGLPHPITLRHRHVVAAARQAGEALGLTPRDVMLAVAPFFHVMGFVISLVAPLSAGATVVAAPRFELAAIERHRVTVLAVPPPIMARLANDPAVDEYDLSSLELIVSGGAPLGAELQAAVAARFPHARVGQGYGLTETTATICGPTRAAGTVPGSVGRPMTGTEIKLVDGELWARGPQVVTDDWLATGDLARVDADGNVFIVDRIKELIKVNAFQVAPAELEALLTTHPAISDAAVVGRPEERRGEAPVAFVVGDAEPDEVRAWVAERVAPYKRLAAVHIVDALPRTPSGKLLRRNLKGSDPFNCGDEQRQLVVGKRARVEQESPVLDPAEHGRVAGA